jgi:thioredoxin-related protein
MKSMRFSAIIFSILFFIPAYTQEVKWYTIEQAIELNKKEPRKIMIDVYTNWCKWCKEMDKNTFNNPIIAAYLNSTFYPVKFNAEQKENIQIDSTTFKYITQGNSGYHELAAALLNGQMSYPSVVFMNEKVQILHVNKGFNPPKEFDGILKFIGGNYYLTDKWETWIANYKSPFN